MMVPTQMLNFHFKYYKYFYRNKNSSSDLDESAKPKFIRSETGKPY
jgi:hypothetical protein